MRPSQSAALFAIVVPSYQAGLAFYRDQMGFELIEDSDMGGGKRWVVLRPRGGTGADILLARAVNQPQSNAIGNQTGGRVGFFLTTDDFDGEYQRLLAQGVSFEETPRHEVYGAVAVFRDPFGNRWDLLQRK